MALEEHYEDIIPDEEHEEEGGVDILESHENEQDEQDEHDHEDKPASKVDDEPSVVPIHALHEEREKRKQFESRMRDMEEKLNKYSTIEEKLAEYQKQKEEESKEPVPEFDYDPTGNLDARVRELQETIKQQREQLEGVQGQTKQQQMLSALGQRINMVEAQFSEANPDYFDALQYVRGVERAKLEPIAKVRGASDEQIQQYLFSQELQLAAELLQSGQNPAEYAYSVAKAYGYNPKAGDNTGDEQRLEQLERGVKQSRTLGPGSGKPPSKDQIDSMSMDEFDEAMKELFT